MPKNNRFYWDQVNEKLKDVNKIYLFQIKATAAGLKRVRSDTIMQL